jgi:hypothetical protein
MTILKESNIFVRIEKWTPENEFLNLTSHFGRNCLRRAEGSFARACFFFRSPTGSGLVTFTPVDACRKI